MHDNSLPTTVQCTSIRLLLNLVEVLFSRRADQRSAEPYRVMLAAILDAFTAKLSSLHNRLAELLAHSELMTLRAFLCASPFSCEVMCWHAQVLGLSYVRWICTPYMCHKSESPAIRSQLAIAGRVQEQKKPEQPLAAEASRSQQSLLTAPDVPVAPGQMPDSAAPGQPVPRAAPASQEGAAAAGQVPAAHAQPAAPAHQAEPMDATGDAPDAPAQEGGTQHRDTEPPSGQPATPAGARAQEPQQAEQAGGASAAADGEGAPADMQPASGQAEGGDTSAMEAQAIEQKEHSATPLKKFEVLYTQERSEKDKEVSLPPALCGVS